MVYKNTRTVTRRDRQKSPSSNTTTTKTKTMRHGHNILQPRWCLQWAVEVAISCIVVIWQPYTTKATPKRCPMLVCWNRKMAMTRTASGTKMVSAAPHVVWFMCIFLASAGTHLKIHSSSWCGCISSSKWQKENDKIAENRIGWYVVKEDRK